MRLDDLLSAIGDRIGGVRGVCLLALDGVVVASAGWKSPADREAVAASYAELLRKAAEAGREASLDAPMELITTTLRGTVLLRVVHPDYAVAVLLAPEASLGRVRYELRKSAGTLLPELDA
jgi:predicted regulator of Ras-like GTPase activity (Roadblock/LC7/MglB family)